MEKLPPKKEELSSQKEASSDGKGERLEELKAEPGSETATQISIDGGIKLADTAEVKEEFEEFMSELSKLSSDNRKFTQEYQLERLLSEDFLNPFDVLELP